MNNCVRSDGDGNDFVQSNPKRQNNNKYPSKQDN
jgi:hypothetical protein